MNWGVMNWHFWSIFPICKTWFILTFCHNSFPLFYWIIIHVLYALYLSGKRSNTYCLGIWKGLTTAGKIFSLCMNVIEMNTDYWLVFKNNTFIVLVYISNRMQRYTVYFIWKLLYVFRVVLSPIIRSTNNCIYSIWYLSHRYCYLPL